MLSQDVGKQACNFSLKTFRFTSRKFMCVDVVVFCLTRRHSENCFFPPSLQPTPPPAHNEASVKTINHSEIHFSGGRKGKIAGTKLRRCINNFFLPPLSIVGWQGAKKETTFVVFIARNVYHFHQSSWSCSEQLVGWWSTLSSLDASSLQSRLASSMLLLFPHSLFFPLVI